MAKNLLIVESPAKAKTMEKFLGKDFSVTSSYGHVRDLKKKGLSIDVENNFSPVYEILQDKKSLISQLKKQVKKADTVWLATDEDREGEAISWHLKEALELHNSQVKRIVFREITKTAILEAVENPRAIDDKLVNAQQARRILDRLVGFELSPVLWKKIKRGLSAGRVQSAAVRMVVEREREIESFEAESFFKVTADFAIESGEQLASELPRRLETEIEAGEFLEKCIGATFLISNLEKKPAKKSPSPPFTTSTLQQEASRVLGYSVSRTMMLAQRLYEGGHITYMRTDSVALSKEALKNAANQIAASYGQEYVKTRQYKTQSASAQEAHEAIRPSDFSISNAGDNRDEKRLYNLIWKRAMASQMASARLEKTVVYIAVSTQSDSLVAKGEVVKFDGFMKIYEVPGEKKEDNGNKGMLPPLTIGQELTLLEMKSTQRFSRPKPRYTEASLVRALEEKGIGRPSTYAPTISTIQKRGYVIKESREGRPRSYTEFILRNNEVTAHARTEITGAEKMKLFPSDMAMIVNDFLVSYFPNVIDLSFTAKVEKEFDDIAAGQTEWHEMIEAFYKKFHPQVLATENGVERAAINPARELGRDPKTGRKVLARMARYGPVVELVSDREDEKSQFAKLMKGQLLETITLEEALDLFLLPRDVGTFEGKKIVAAIGRFGPYIRHDSKFVSLGKDHDPYTVTEETAIELIRAKREADAKKTIKVFEQDPDVKILRGRWGPYLSFNKTNIKIPKDKDPETLTWEECVQLADTAPAKKAPAQKEKPATKTPPKKKKTSAGTKKKIDRR